MSDNSYAGILINLVLELNTEFILDQHQNTCAVIEGQFIAYPIKSKFIKRYLSQIFWKNTGKAIRSDILSSVINTLEGMALNSDECKHVYNRVAKINDEIYYDIGDNKNLIKISKDGWEVTQSSPVLFRRLTHQKKQVLPEPDGDLSELDEFINVRGEVQDLLLKTYLPTAFFQDIARPVLLIHGPQGSGKSTTLQRIRDLIDPSIIPLLSPQDKEEELTRQADHNYCFFIDNVSSINWKTSDALCRFVTGSAFSKRELYTNDDDILYSFKRVVGINGISQAATRADLLDRSLIIELERISSSVRKRESELNNLFEQKKPKIFGALLDLVSAILAFKDEIEISNLPRLADYYHYAATASVYLGFYVNHFEKTFQLNIEKQHETSLEASPVAQCVLLFMHDKAEWKSSPSELYENLQLLAVQLSLNRGFPNAANWLWKSLARDEQTLRAYNINIFRDKEAGIRVIGLENTAFGQQNSIDSTTQEHINNLKKYVEGKSAVSNEAQFIA